MKKTLISLVTVLSVFTAVHADNLLDSLEYTVRLGYSIGGMAPVNMPATIRELNKFQVKPNVSLGIDARKPIGDKWGIMVGMHLERKAMEIDATVKNYHMEIVRGGESLEGYFTGRNATEADIWMFTVPVLATLDVCDNVRLKLGPYVSFVTSHEFSGSAYGGYLRVDDPTGVKVELGNEEGTRGTYDFSDRMRKLHYGVKLGCDWNFYRHWGAYADISWGLNGIFHSNFNTIEQTLYPIYGTIGITYKLSN